MHKIVKFTLSILTLFAVASASAAGAPMEKRMALVIGNSAYQAGPLATPANDAGLIAQTLQAAGFDVVGARDLDEDSLRHAFRDFVDNASKAGPDTVVAVYFAGYALQDEGENYLVPIDANLARESDVPVRTLRLSDYTRALAALHLKATMVVLDAARANPFSQSGQRLASGLALAEPDPDMLIAFNAAPGTVAPESPDGYGPYAKALAEMIREGGLQPAEVFDRVRLRVNDMTKGAQVPWDASKIQAQFVFFERGPDAPAPAASTEQASRPLRDLGAQDAYLAALSRDTMDGYEDFLAAYPHDPMAKRVRGILAARREAITWRLTYQADLPEGYWSYLRRYPRGAHAADARRRLAHLAAAFEPPPQFTMIDYDVPPPPPDEAVYYERPVLIFDDPIFAFAPPPPPPVYFLEPPPPEFVALEPPLPPFGAFILPVPVFVPVPLYVSAPAYVAPPPNPIIFNNIHNTVVVNNTTNVVTITKPGGQVVSTAPISPPAHGGGSTVPTLAPALPPSVAPKAALINSQNPPSSAANPAAVGASKVLPASPATGAQPTATLPTPPTATVTPPATGNKALPTPPAATVTPPATGNKALPTPPAATVTPPATGNKALPTPPAATVAPPATGNKALPTPPAATVAPPATGNKALPTPPAATVAPPATGNKALPTPPAATGAPPAAAIVHQAPTSPAVHQTPPPPPVVHQLPPAAHQAPPPPVVHQTPPPPPPLPPPPAVRQVQSPPPPPVAARPPAPPAAAAAKPAGKCQVVNGKEVCK